MRTINVQQGSREWLAIRAQHHTASEAPAMMGASRYQTRDQLLHQKHTGITQEIDGHTQALFDRGHATEAAARVLLEQDLGEELYPVTALDDAGRLLASFDGITVDDSTGFEHKLYSECLAGQVRAGDLEPHYYWQLEQQILVGGLEKVIFVTSDGTRENWAQMTYCPVPGRAEQLLAGWAQFDADLAAWVPPAPVAVISPVAKVRSALPALVFDAKGEVTACNVDEFKAEVLERINSTNMDLITDQDFADGESDAKWLRDVSVGMKTAVQRVRSGMVSVNEVLTVLEQLDKLSSDKAIAVEKMVKARKEHLRGEIVAGGVTALRKHIDTLNQSIGRSYVPMVSADFGGVVKGKRSLDSIQGAVNDELARAKIAANEVAARIQHNLKTLHDAPGINLSLFPDVATIVLKACDDFAALVQARMAQHQAAEQQRMDAERERIRGEEAAKLRREEDAKASAAEHAAKAITQAAAPEAVPATPESLRGSYRRVWAAPVQAQAVAAPVRDDDCGERINLTAINAYLAPIKLDAAGLSVLGFEPVEVVKASKLYRASSMMAIRAALIEHLTHMYEMEVAA